MTMTWKQQLRDETDPAISREIDVFEVQMKLRRQGKLDEKLFAETRLRRGIYGQRYDNGERHDGVRVQHLSYPSGETVKGPETLWDAPGMQRIKIPYGGVTPHQLEVLAEVSEEYADSILHVTTRQDFQLHFVHIDDTPDLMRRLAAADAFGSMGLDRQQALWQVRALRDEALPLFDQEAEATEGSSRLASRRERERQIALTKQGRSTETEESNTEADRHPNHHPSSLRRSVAIPTP